jgi:Transposase IS66 family
LSDAARTALRQRKCLLRFNPLHEWASALMAHNLPSSKLGDAMSYLLKQEPKLVGYLNDSRLAIGTNLAENDIRPCVTGKLARLCELHPRRLEDTFYGDNHVRSSCIQE